MKRIQIAVLFLLGIVFAVSPIMGQDTITTPKEQFGYDIGDDYWLATYSQLVDYWKKLEQESPRMILEEIGTTSEGRPMIMAIITSPENHTNLIRYKEIARRLALAEGIEDKEAHALAREGKAVVWIDGGLHATEVSGAQQELELVYQMVSGNDAETLRILDNVILLALISNPDGMENIGHWYMRESDPKKRSTSGLPYLYQKYVGHDNNRDFYMMNMKETETINRILYREWFPQIVYNHHQTGPSGAVLFAPPFREPHNYNYDPLLVLGINVVGSAMHSRFMAEGKAGSTMREGAWYQTWWNGCLRCTPYFHNMIGILTEMIGNPTPVTIPFIPEKHLANGDYPFPIAPQTWHFRRSIEYSITADRAILDTAARLKENFLFNIYRMGKNSIEKGSRDHWTITPRRIEAVQAVIEKDGAEPMGSGRRSRGYDPKYFEVLRDPDARDPRGFIVPSNQPDFLTATKFINTLIKAGVAVHRATESFQVGGKTYPEGSYVVKSAQAFRPHVIDMFEPQHYPDDISYPGGPPRAPYDSAGYTLAFQMGVKFDRILESFGGPFEKLEELADVPRGRVKGSDVAGFLLDHRVNDAFTAINRLIKSGEDVYWLRERTQINGRTLPEGAIYIPAKTSLRPKLQDLAQEKGLIFEGVPIQPKGEVLSMNPPRIGLWDRYGGSMPSGWVSWLLEQFEFDFEVIFPQRLDSGNLKSKFDVLIFVGGAIPGIREDEYSRYFSRSQPDPKTIPPEYRNKLGRITVEKTIPQLRRFLEEGGTILTIGSSASLGYHLGLPISDALIEMTADGKERPLPMEKHFVPGSVLQVKVDTSNPLAYGLPEELNVYFNRSPVFELEAESIFLEVKPVAWFDTEKPLRSGWAWGQHYLKGGIAVVEASVGKGKLFLFGPEITFRAQPHGSFKFLFNGIYLSTATSTTL
ncbi:MAG: M14 family metallopeptidase [Candidatus Aminicenantes bacterium]